jgi:aminopeptidase N
VKQTQRVEGRVGLFHIPTDVEITTASGAKLFPVTVSGEKDTAVFTFHADAAPLMVLFDKGGHILKSAEFHKEKKEWLYQLKNASELADRADAVSALGKLKGDDEVVAALAETLRSDKAWGIRANAADALGQLGGAAASKKLLEALDTAKEPWVRNRVVSALANFKDDTVIAAKLTAIAADDNSYRARAAALQALGRLKAPGALATLDAAVAADSPDGFLRNAALRSMGALGDDKAVPLLREWTAIGKPIDSRNAAIASLARLQKDNKEITTQIAGYLNEPRFPIRMASIFALGARGDTSAVPALEALLKSDDLSIEMVPMIKRQIETLKAPAGEKRGPRHGASPGDEESAVGGNDEGEVAKRLDRLEQLMQEMADRLKTIETRLPPPKQ